LKETVFLGVGSNVGDREQSIAMASQALAVILDEMSQSHLYETLPRYNEKQPKFLNCVFSGKTGMGPHELLDQLQVIEDAAGRDRATAGWMGPRPLDIDILLYGRRQISSPRLDVPHPRMKERKFVLVPLLDLDPLLRDPKTNELYTDVLDNLGPQGIYYHTSNSV
jgi:2-amino-4-hydroxy-6-hydroxymethyldihydropteridine diphosphokinase